MRKIFPWLVLLAGASACAGTDATESAPPEAALGTGTWTIGYSELANDCGSEGKLFPLAPTHVSIEERADEVILTSPGEEPRTYSARGNRWFRDRHEELDACAASLHENWQVHQLSSGRLSAIYDARLDLSGDCDIPGLHSCGVRYSVWGARR